jgi:hypothetical protein
MSVFIGGHGRGAPILRQDEITADIVELAAVAVQRST